MTSRHQIEPLGASLPRLVRCIRDLGLRAGWKYWRMGNRAIQNPGLVLQWADLCDDEARETIDPKLKAALQDWAQKLRVHWYLWVKQKQTAAQTSRPEMIRKPVETGDGQCVEVLGASAVAVDLHEDGTVVILATGGERTELMEFPAANDQHLVRRDAGPKTN